MIPKLGVMRYLALSQPVRRTVVRVVASGIWRGWTVVSTSHCPNLSEQILIFIFIGTLMALLPGPTSHCSSVTEEILVVTFRVVFC
jgi:hypothetical protein